MFKDYLADIFDGRLARSRFIALWLGLVLAFIGIGWLIGTSFGMLDPLIGGDLSRVSQGLQNNLSLPGLILVVLIAALFAFAQLNILGKRARDVGLPGWLTAFVITAFSGAAYQALAFASAVGLGVVLLLALAVIPSNALRPA